MSRSERETVTCQVCGKMLYGVRSLQSHMLLHEGKPQRCPYCPYTTVFKQVSSDDVICMGVMWYSAARNMT